MTKNKCINCGSHHRHHKGEKIVTTTGSRSSGTLIKHTAWTEKGYKCKCGLETNE